VSDDDCRQAVNWLNQFRWERAEFLDRGYVVSDILSFYDVNRCYTSYCHPAPSRTRFHANRQGCSCQIYGRYDVSAINPWWNRQDFDTAYSTACAKYDDLAKSTRAEVEKALAGTDTSDLRASFRRALSFSTPPPTLYRNYRPGAYSELIFGVPLVDAETNQDNVPTVMRMCIEEVENRGLNTKGIYSVS
jgi:hypothetical protein